MSVIGFPNLPIDPLFASLVGGIPLAPGGSFTLGGSLTTASAIDLNLITSSLMGGAPIAFGGSLILPGDKRIDSAFGDGGATGGGAFGGLVSTSPLIILLKSSSLIFFSLSLLLVWPIFHSFHSLPLL